MNKYNLGKVAPIYRGTYDSSTSYNELDIVFDNTSGRSFIAKKPVNGNSLPTVGNIENDYWGLISGKGAKGDKTYGSDGYLRESTVLKNDLDLTPYDVVEGTIDLVEGDHLTEENVNRMYNALSVEKIYSLYDALVTQNKRMRHAEQWGVAGGLPLKWYHFEPENRFLVPVDSKGESNFDKYNRLNGSKPLLFITSGIHGNEKSNVWALYLTIRGIANGETELDRYLRRNYEIVVLPCVNPYGLENNQRHNENDVDINRNFPYTWDEDTNQWKGTAPFSEQSSRFVQEIRDKFLSENNLGYKQGMLFIDSHDFNFKNNDDERIMWTGATNGLVRNSLLKTGGLVKDKITSLYPKLVTGERQNFFALLGSGNGYGATLNAWNNSCGIKSISMESPDYLTILGVNNRYSIQSSTISYMLVRDFILQSTLDLSGKAAPDVTVGFSNAMSTENDNLLDILQNVPSGKTLTIGVYSHTSKLAQQMPKSPDGINYMGVLKATKSSASTSNSGTVEFTTTGFETTHKFFSSFNTEGVGEWQEAQPAKLFTTFTSLNLSNDSASLLDVFNRLPNGSTADLYIQPDINMHNDLPDGITNYAKIRISRNTSNTGFVELFSFQSVNRMYVMNISLGQKTEWTLIANDSKVVHNTDNETIAGDKTFTGNVVVNNTLEASSLYKKVASTGATPFLEIDDTNLGIKQAIGHYYSSNKGGNGITLGAGGLTIVGGGESAEGLGDVFNEGLSDTSSPGINISGPYSENTIIASDYYIYFMPGQKEGYPTFDATLRFSYDGSLEKYTGSGWTPLIDKNSTLLAQDSDVVHNTGNETVAGNKTFSGNTTIGGTLMTDSGWENMSLASDVTATIARYRLLNGIVYIQVLDVTTDVGKVFFTLPDGYRPPHPIWESWFAGNKSGNFLIGDSGEVSRASSTASGTDSGTKASFEASYPID